MIEGKSEDALEGFDPAYSWEVQLITTLSEYRGEQYPGRDADDIFDRPSRML
jgi:hypothetical protein